MIPDDWNVWIVGEHAELIMRKHWTGSRWAYACWDAYDLSVRRSDVWPDRRLMMPLDPPKNPEALIQAAETIAAAVPGPSLRVDFFEDDKGPIFGELTPFSSAGRNRFSPAWEQRLGTMWPEEEQ